MKLIWKDYKKGFNKYVTKQAFAEYNHNDDYKPTFTTSDTDKDDLLSFSKLFISYYMDPTETRFVEDVFDGDWKHWEVFKTSQGIDEIYATARKASDQKLKAEAMNKVIAIAFDDGNKNNLQALKFLIGDKVEKTPKTVGRPKKDKKEPEIDSKTLLEDIKRLG